jgi:hypothetical protein
MYQNLFQVTLMLVGQSNTPEHRRKINGACGIYFLRSDVAVLRQLTRCRRMRTKRSLRSGVQYCERATAGKKLTTDRFLRANLDLGQTKVRQP